MLRLGDPLHDGVTIGPVVTAASARRVRGPGRRRPSARGAEALVLGAVDADTDLGRGHYLRPTLVLGADDDDPLVAEEQFGPAVPLLAYDSVDEAVARANAGDLGLGASVWSADEERAFAVAARLEAGFTFVNTHNRTGHGAARAVRRRQALRLGPRVRRRGRCSSTPRPAWSTRPARSGRVAAGSAPRRTRLADA